MKKKRKILITGISGQDASLIIDKLQGSQCWEVYGISHNKNIIHDSKTNDFEIYNWDFVDQHKIDEIVKKIQPDVFINLASFSSGIGMFENTAQLSQVNGISVIFMLESIRHFSPKTLFLQAGSSEMFGNTPDYPQTEVSPMLPRTPYGAAKLFAHNNVRIYRQKYNLLLNNMILYNHESVYRRDIFVTKKIVKSAVAIKNGNNEKLQLINLDSARDWSYAPDFVDAMFLIIDQAKSSDYIFSSGKLTTVRELCEIVFSYLDLDYNFYVEELDTKIELSNNLLGNPNKLEDLGFKRTKDVKEFMIEMTENELNNFRE